MVGSLKADRSARSTASAVLSVEQALAAATLRLAGSSDSARADAEILLSHQLACTRAQLFLHARETLNARDAEAYEQALRRRLRAEPVAYITGEQGFWTLTLAVTPAVLIPRPETELLVERALQLLGVTARPRIADLGTGSGCIALALAAERPDAQIVACDLAEAALAVACRNAEQLSLRGVRFVQAGFAEFLERERAFDLILSNPPYIPKDDQHLSQLRHEPAEALSDGADGLRYLSEIVGAAPAALAPGAHLLLEHGYDQAAAVRALLAESGFTGIETWRDLAGHERVTESRRR